MTTRALIPAAVLLIGCSLHRRPAVIEPTRGPTRDSLLLLDQTRGDSVVGAWARRWRSRADGYRGRLSPRRHSGRLWIRRRARPVRSRPGHAGSVADVATARWRRVARLAFRLYVRRCGTRRHSERIAASRSLYRVLATRIRQTLAHRGVHRAQWAAGRGDPVLRRSARATRRCKSRDPSPRSPFGCAMRTACSPTSPTGWAPQSRSRARSRPTAPSSADRDSSSDRRPIREFEEAQGAGASLTWRPVYARRRRIRRSGLHGRRVHRHGPKPVGRGRSEIWKVSHRVAATARRELEVRHAWRERHEVSGRSATSRRAARPLR